MTLAAVQGQPRAIEALRSALRRGAIHHAWLFAGPEGVGKELTAIGFAQALTCQVKPLEGCGECPSCGRVARRNHPDVQWLMPEAEMVSRGIAGRSDFANAPSREIKVEQIRALQERLALHPLEGERKLAIIASAHQMNPAAQNAFLKTLEEPPSGTVLVLVASAPDKMLPTIRSRCSRVSFGPLPASFIAGELARQKQIDPDSAHLAAVMSSGSLSRALEIDAESLAQRKDVISRFEALSFNDARTLLDFAATFGESREAAEDALRILDLWTRDVAVMRAGSDALANRDLAELAQTAAGKVPDAELHRRHQLIDAAFGAITARNGSPRLQLERMLIEMARTSGAAGGGR